MEKKYAVVIESLPDRHIPVLRELRALSGFGLKEAKALLSYTQANCPCILLAGISKALAENWASRLNSAGARVAIQESRLM